MELGYRGRKEAALVIAVIAAEGRPPEGLWLQGGDKVRSWGRGLRSAPRPRGVAPRAIPLRREVGESRGPAGAGGPWPSPGLAEARETSERGGAEGASGRSNCFCRPEKGTSQN